MVKRNTQYEIRNTYKVSPNLGFTLIELLVVISIIGILASLSLVGISGSQKQARDSQRKSDLSQYRVALESYAGSNGGKYPGFADRNLTAISSEDNNLCSATGANSLSLHMSNTCLLDPKQIRFCTTVSYDLPGLKYCYLENGSTNNASATEYLLYGGLETGGWWEICSNGKAGKISVLPGNVDCDLP